MMLVGKQAIGSYLICIKSCSLTVSINSLLDNWPEAE